MIIYGMNNHFCSLKGLTIMFNSFLLLEQKRYNDFLLSIEVNKLQKITGLPFHSQLQASSDEIESLHSTLISKRKNKKKPYSLITQCTF